MRSRNDFIIGAKNFLCLGLSWLFFVANRVEQAFYKKF